MPSNFLDCSSVLRIGLHLSNFDCCIAVKLTCIWLELLTSRLFEANHYLLWKQKSLFAPVSEIFCGGQIFWLQYSFLFFFFVSFWPAWSASNFVDCSSWLRIVFDSSAYFFAVQKSCLQVLMFLPTAAHLVCYGTKLHEYLCGRLWWQRGWYEKLGSGVLWRGVPATVWATRS